MEDNDKRKSSEPSVSSASSGEESSQTPGARRSEPDMFDAHEQTLPRFTIEPGEAAGPRQRTRTLLGVPSLVSEEASGSTARAAEADAPRLPAPPALGDTPERVQAERGPSERSAGPASSTAAQPSEREPVTDSTIDITVEVDHMDDVTIVSDADVVALPDSTGQLQPVRLDEPPTAKEEPDTQAAPASAAAQPSSLSPREIAKPAAAAEPRESSGRYGALLVAAVMLLATGAWFLTAGTFRRATLSTPAESTTAAATQPSQAAPEKVEPQAAPTEAPAPSSADALSAAPPTLAPAAPTPAEPATEEVAPAALEHKPALTASARGERVRRATRANKGKVPAEPTGDLPAGPTRSEVVSRLESVRSSVQACAAGRTGIADLDITIAHTGVVMHVLVGGDFAGTTEGSCIARAVRQARFPQFTQERFRLLYPYAI